MCNPLIMGCKTPGNECCMICVPDTAALELVALEGPDSAPLGHLPTPEMGTGALGQRCNTQLQNTLQKRAGRMNLHQNQK